MADRLNETQVDQALAGLEGWRSVAGRRAIAKTFKFADFRTAFGFMTKVALASEAANHHPEWRNIYAKVEIVLTTHSADGVTASDISLAHEIDRLSETRPR